MVCLTPAAAAAAELHVADSTCWNIRSRDLLHQLHVSLVVRLCCPEDSMLVAGVSCWCRSQSRILMVVKATLAASISQLHVGGGAVPHHNYCCTALHQDPNYLPHTIQADASDA